MKNMRIVILIVLCIGVNFLAVCKYREYVTIRSVANKIIRFHVIANSDTKRDQLLKLKIRDSVIKYMYNKLEEANAIEDCRSILLKEENAIINISKDIITNLGYDYEVKTELAHEEFPEKTYGNITLPKGDYEAFRIIIGEGKGQNWWCVMFPPLCLVDLGQGKMAFQANESKMKSVLNDREYKAVDNSKENPRINTPKNKNKEYNQMQDSIYNKSKEEERIDKQNKKSSKNNIKFRFKILEVIENIL